MSSNFLKDIDSASVSLVLNDDEETRKLWNFKFEIVYEIRLTNASLKTNLIIKNTGLYKFVLIN